MRGETVPDDIHGMEVAVGILTSRGGMTSHAAVVTRGMGKACVAGCGAAEVDEKDKTAQDRRAHLSRKVTGFPWTASTGRVIEGKCDLVLDRTLKAVYFAEFMRWADEAT